MADHDWKFTYEEGGPVKLERCARCGWYRDAVLQPDGSYRYSDPRPTRFVEYVPQTKRGAWKKTKHADSECVGQP